MDEERSMSGFIYEHWKKSTDEYKSQGQSIIFLLAEFMKIWMRAAIHFFVAANETLMEEALARI